MGCEGLDLAPVVFVLVMGWKNRVGLRFVGAGSKDMQEPGTAPAWHPAGGGRWSSFWLHGGLLGLRGDGRLR